MGDIAVERAPEDPCLPLSRGVQRLCAGLLLAEGLLLTAFVFDGLPEGARTATLTGAFTGIWTLWILVQVQNHRMVRCGPLRERFRIAPLLINRSGLVPRTIFHLTINWSAIGATVAAMIATGPTEMDRAVGFLCLGATALVWLSFNLLHRKVSRLRNLLLTSAVASALVLCSSILVVR